MKKWRSHIAIAATTVLLPLIVVPLIPSDSVSPYSFEATLTSQLGQSSNEQLVYYEAQVAQGEAPADIVVVALDLNYTRGLDDVAHETGSTGWFRGSLMTPEVFYGEQYLFFGIDEVYVSQVKTGVFWPNQVTELRILYLSPLTTVFAPIQIPFILRSDSLSSRIIGTLLARCALLFATAIFVRRRRSETASVLLILLIYAVIAMLLTLPIIGDLY
ncbi:MAG: hypothetical protein JW846_04345 [Dehalococcoidia bacterium]|nr:hypothetical protein [Dehalococcoidia bacterium]